MNDDLKLPKLSDEDMEKPNTGVEVNNSSNTTKIDDMEVKDKAVETNVVSDDKVTFIKTFNEVHKFIIKSNGKEIFKFVLQLLLICVFILLIKLPLDLIKDFGITVINALGIKITDVILNVWTIILNLGYTIFGIVYFCLIFKNKFADINNKVVKEKTN